jgi:hypothetical protein
VPNGDGRLRVTLRSTGSPLQTLRFGDGPRALSNAVVEMADGRGGITGGAVELSDRPTDVTFFVRRQDSGAATMVPLVVVRPGCPDWQTFVGGGPTAF